MLVDRALLEANLFSFRADADAAVREILDGQGRGGLAADQLPVLEELFYLSGAEMALLPVFRNPPPQTVTHPEIEVTGDDVYLGSIKFGCAVYLGCPAQVEDLVLGDLVPMTGDQFKLKAVDASIGALLRDLPEVLAALQRLYRNSGIGPYQRIAESRVILWQGVIWDMRAALLQRGYVEMDELPAFVRRVDELAVGSSQDLAMGTLA